MQRPWGPLDDAFSDEDLRDAASELRARWQRGEYGATLLVAVVALLVFALPLVLAVRG